MTIQTLAQPYAWDGSWKRGTGTNKGSWVWDGSWKQIKELYVWDNGSWKYNIPVSIASCLLIPGTKGTCGAVLATYRIQSNWLGPMPQRISGSGSYYSVEHWDRQSFTAIGIFSAPWVLRDTSILQNSQIYPNSRDYLFVILAPPDTDGTHKWHQAKAQLVHSVTGDVPAVSGGMATSLVRNFYINDCDIE